MKTPIDSAGAGAGSTTALLNGGAQIVMLDLYKITLNGGAVVRWHGGAGNPLLAADSSYSFTAFGAQSTAANGKYLKAAAPLDRGKITTKLGLQVATMDVTVKAGPADLINGVPIIPFAMARGFDGALVTLFKGFLPNWQSGITGVVIAFAGEITSVRSISRTGFTLTVSASTVRLNVNMGPDVFQASCLNNHYDPNCGLVPTLGVNLFNGTVAAGSPTAVGFNSNLTNADHLFDKGKVVFTSGPNNGLARTVQVYLNASGALTFAYGFPNAPAVGNTFQVYRGCLLSMTDCTAQSNLLKFRGQPFIPPAIQGVVG